MKKSKLNEQQIEYLSMLKDLYDRGVNDPKIRGALGLTRLHLSGAGPAFSGLIRRNLVEEKNRIFYITDAGRAALAAYN